MASQDHVRRSILSAISGRRDGTPAFSQFADEIEQNLVNKRLRLGESVVDTAQPSVIRVGKAVIGALGNETKIESAIREIVRFELGPIKTHQTVIETCQRETKLYKEQLEQLERDKEETLQEIIRLKAELAEAKTFPRDEVEKLAKTCNKLPTKSQTEITMQNMRAEIARLAEQREKLKEIVETRKKKVINLAQVLEDFRQEAKIG